MYSFNSHNSLDTILVTFYSIFIITILHIPVYIFLQHYFSDSLQALSITLIIYLIVLTTYFTIFPFTKYPTTNKQPEEEN